MDKLVKSVKKKYNERRICVEQKQPWSRQSNRLVRLQLVNKKKVDGSSTSARRGEDKKITPLAYGDLFKAESGERPVRKVLVEGDAGIGKTTLTVSLSEEWASDKLFQEFELILLLPLRLEKVASAGSLHKLLEVFHSDEEIYKSVDSYLKKKEGENVLVIADGWDELSECQRNKSSLLYQFLFVDFPLMSVLVTSRPSTSAPLHNLACIDRFVEIKGFGEDNIKEYVQSEFATDQKKAQRLLEQLQYNPLIQSVCSVPLNCAIVCHLWHTLKEDLPSTMTQLYEKIILHFVCHNLRKLPAYGSTFSMASFNDLPEGLQKSWWLLCEFAFKALEKDQIVFSKKQLPEISKDGNEQVLCFGLLQSVETVLALTTEVSYNFLHLTFMEYLAALHLSRQPLDSSWLKLLRNNCGMVLRFFFGIRFCDTKIGADIGNFMQNIQYVERLSLFHCVFEAQNAIVNREVRFGGKLCQPHNPHDCAAILYVIGNMQECSDLKINFDYSGVRENQIKQLADVLASKDGKLQVKRLSLRGNKLTDKIVSYLFNRALAAFHSLTRLDLSGNRIGAESIKSIKTALAKSSPSGCTLSWLSLSYNPLEKCGLRALDNALHEGVLSNLNTLYLSGSLTSDADTNASRLTSFVEALSAHCPYMRKLDLSRNHLDVLRATALARSISRLQQPHSTSDGELISMVLTQTNLSDEGLRAFVDSLEGACYFEHLHLGDNDIHANGVSCLADAVHSGKIVLTSRLNLSENALGLEGALAIGRMLSSNHCKPYCLLLYRCKLTTGGSGLPNTVSLNRDSNISSEVIGRQLCQMPQNNAIVKLVLMGNSFTGNDIHILAAFMYLCPGLRFLFTDQCGITSDDLKQLFDTLPSLIPVMPFSNLEEWWLDDNQIDDGGVSALIDHLPPLLLSPNDIDIHLDGNPAITSYRETKERLKEKQGSHKEVRCVVKQFLLTPLYTWKSVLDHLMLVLFFSSWNLTSMNYSNLTIVNRNPLLLLPAVICLLLSSCHSFHESLPMMTTSKEQRSLCLSHTHLKDHTFSPPHSLRRKPVLAKKVSEQIIIHICEEFSNCVYTSSYINFISHVHNLFVHLLFSFCHNC